MTEHARNAPRVVLAGHGAIADGVRDAVELILGPRPELSTVRLAPEDAPEDLRRSLLDIVEDVPGREVVVLVDMQGGTPSNVAASLAATWPGVQVVAGLSLPMALEVLTTAGRNADELAKVAVRAGSQSIVDVAASVRDTSEITAQQP